MVSEKQQGNCTYSYSTDHKGQNIPNFLSNSQEFILWKKEMQVFETLNIILNSLTRKSFINTDKIKS